MGPITGRSPRGIGYPMVSFSKKPKVALIGIDSATWRVIEPLVKRGKLPTFARLMREGCHGALKTLYPTLSPIIWGTLSTGKTPDEHGLKAFTVLKARGLEKAFYEYRWEQLSPLMRAIYRVTRLASWRKMLTGRGWLRSIPMTSNFRKCKALWNVVSESGRTAGFVSWWNTWPAEQVNGFIVSQYVEDLLSSPEAHLIDAAYPAELLEEAVRFLRTDQQLSLDEMGRFFDLNPEEAEELARVRYTLTDPDPSQFHPARFLKLVYLRQEYRIQAGLHFYRKYRPDLFGLFLDADAVQHFFWHCYEPQHFEAVDPRDVARYGRAIESWYGYLDGLLSRILSEIDKGTTVVIVSDHGHGPSGQLPWSGQHEDAPDGIILLAGPAVRVGGALQGATVFDVVPTVLALMGLPVGEDMPGRVLAEALKTSFLRDYPITSVPTYDTDGMGGAAPVESEVDEAVKARLRDLGYLE